MWLGPQPRRKTATHPFPLPQVLDIHRVRSNNCSSFSSLSPFRPPSRGFRRGVPGLGFRSFLTGGGRGAGSCVSIHREGPRCRWKSPTGPPSQALSQFGVRFSPEHSLTCRPKRAIRGSSPSVVRIPCSQDGVRIPRGDSRDHPPPPRLDRHDPPSSIDDHEPTARGTR
jgi:hypothetical protein